MGVIPAQGMLRQEDHEFELSLGCTRRPSLKNKQTSKQTKRPKRPIRSYHFTPIGTVIIKKHTKENPKRDYKCG
jgi:hypothetical protein